MATPVTDPEVLKRFRASQDPTLTLFDPNSVGATKVSDAPARKPVTDPAVLARFNKAKQQPDWMDNAGEDLSKGNVLSAIGDTPLAKGIHEGVTNRGIGVIQTVYDAMKAAGIANSPELEAAMQKAHANVEAGAKGSGIGGTVGELAGDPVNWLGGGAGAAERQIVKQAGVAAMRKSAQAGGTRAVMASAARKAITRRLAVDGAKLGGKIGAVGNAIGVQKNDDLSTRGEAVVEGAAKGAATGAAIPYATSAVGKTVRGAGTAASDIGASRRFKSDDEINATTQRLRDEAVKLIDSARNAKVALADPAAIAKAARAPFMGTDRLSAIQHPETMKILDTIDQQAADGKLDLPELMARLKDFGTTEGADGAMSGKAKKAIISALGQAGSLNGAQGDIGGFLTDLTRSDAQFAKAFRYGDVGKVVQSANADPNRLKTSLSRFAREGENTNNLTGDEVDALGRAKSNGVLETLLRFPGGLGVDAGSLSRNPRVVLPYLLSRGANLGGAAVAGAATGAGALPAVAVGTAANTVRAMLARGKATKLLETIENRELPGAVNAPHVPPTAPPPTLALPAPGYSAGMTPSQVAAAQAVHAAPQPAAPASASGTIFAPGPAPSPNRVYGDVPYATQPAPAAAQPLQLPAPGTVYEPSRVMEAPQNGQPRPMNPVQQQANDSVRDQYNNNGLSLDVLHTQRNNQVSAAEAAKAIQDAAALQNRAEQVQQSAPAPSIGDVIHQSDQAAADVAAATGQAPAAPGQVGLALRAAVAKAAAKHPPHPAWYVPEDQLPSVTLPTGATAVTE